MERAARQSAAAQQSEERCNKDYKLILCLYKLTTVFHSAGLRQDLQSEKEARTLMTRKLKQIRQDGGNEDRETKQLKCS